MADELDTTYDYLLVSDYGPGVTQVRKVIASTAAASLTTDAVSRLRVGLLPGDAGGRRMSRFVIAPDCAMRYARCMS